MWFRHGWPPLNTLSAWFTRHYLGIYTCLGVKGKLNTGTHPPLLCARMWAKKTPPLNPKHLNILPKTKG